MFCRCIQLKCSVPGFQMMVCTTDEEVNVEDTDSPKKKDKDKRYLWNHGSKCCAKAGNSLKMKCNGYLFILEQICYL